MIPALLAVGVFQAIAVGAVAADTGTPVVAAIVGGIFLVINSLLTIVLTRIIDRRYEEQHGERRSEHRKSARAAKKNRHPATGDRANRDLGNGG